MQAAKEAVNKAEAATEKRFEATNEFRGQLADQTATLLPRKEYDSNHQALEDKIDLLTDRMNRSEGQTKGADKTWAVIVTIIITGIAVVGFIIGAR